MASLPMQHTAEKALPDLLNALLAVARGGSAVFGVEDVASLLVQPSPNDSGYLVRSRDLKDTARESITIYDFQNHEEILDSFRLFLLRSKRARDKRTRSHLVS